MDLILWRHGEAEDDRQDVEDWSRQLTPKGERQVQRVASWLDRQLPDGLRVMSSPTLRTEQTVKALGRKYKLRDELSPGADVDDLLQLSQWPKAKGVVLAVGHQPQLGMVISHLLGFQNPMCHVRKGAVWWLRSREREGQLTTTLMAVHGPDLI